MTEPFDYDGLTAHIRAIRTHDDAYDALRERIEAAFVPVEHHVSVITDHDELLQHEIARAEAAEAELRRVHYDSIHTCWDECPQLPCVQRREIERLTAELAEARQAERAAVWVYPKNIDDMPKKPGKESYEYVPCLIIHKGDVLSRPWNCEHQVFDDEHQDDYYCDWWEITAYMDLSALIKAYAPPVAGEPA